MCIFLASSLSNLVGKDDACILRHLHTFCPLYFLCLCLARRLVKYYPINELRSTTLSKMEAAKQEKLKAKKSLSCFGMFF